MKQYGQLGSRLIGIVTQYSTTLIPCIYDGWYYLNNKDFTDVGSCSGQIFSQVLDSMF